MSNQTKSFFSHLMGGLCRRAARHDKALSARLEELLGEGYGSLLESSSKMEEVSKAMDLAAAKAAVEVLEAK